ncbi:hypothetical protein OF83DRAFT_194074 [Amylostereum chailletii]|nr:hypothetical protein OF83DRAFT_194074 [Amylostereum chailletii]
MASRTASPPDALAVSAVLDDHTFPQEPVQDKISAYYSLIFPNFTYYLQTLEVTIGRRCIPNSTASTSDQAQVDVDLGPLKSVSRLHAKIEYEEEEERFVLVVLGRNGAWVDGIWSARGSKVPLGERSQIQIASRTFHFVLPPPPVPEDSPSPSSHTSSHRPRSPSVDITSLSPPSSVPSFSPPPRATSPPPHKVPPLPDPPQLPNSNAIGKGKQVAGKKRKAGEVEPAKPRPKPEEMPPKPHFTYAQLCYRAIKGLGGRATLQDIIGWMIDNYDWYRLNEGAGWEVSYLVRTLTERSPDFLIQKSVRHNLSSNRAFRKVERSAGERGKGYYWTVEPEYEHTFEEQEARALIALSSGGKDGKTKKGKAAARGDGKGAPPPLMTSTPLTFKSTASSTPAPAPSVAPTPSVTVKSELPTETKAVVKAEPLPTPRVPPVSRHPPPATAPTNASHAVPQPIPPSAAPTTTMTSSLPAPAPSASSMSPPATSTDLSTAHSSSSTIPPVPPSVILPIIVGPVPTTDPASSAPVPHLGTPPIVLHDNQLILNPTIFAHLTPEQLRALEALGAQKALEILQKHIVRFLREKIRTEGGARGRGRGRAKRGRGGGVRGGKEEAGGSGAKADGGADGEGTSRENATGPTTTAQPVAGKAQPSQSTSTTSSAPDPPPSLSTDVTMAGVDDPASPIVVVDDDDDEPLEGPVPKRRRLNVPGMQAVSV